MDERHHDGRHAFGVESARTKLLHGVNDAKDEAVAIQRRTYDAKNPHCLEKRGNIFALIRICGGQI